MPQNLQTSVENETILMEVEVQNGIIQDVRLQIPPELIDPEMVDISEVLLKMDFDNRLVNKFEAKLNAYVELSQEKKDFLIQSLDEMISHFV